MSRSAAPELYAPVDEVAAALGTRSVDVIALDARTNASVTHLGVRRRVLTLGLPLWEVLSPQERIALDLLTTRASQRSEYLADAAAAPVASTEAAVGTMDLLLVLESVDSTLYREVNARRLGGSRRLTAQDAEGRWPPICAAPCCSASRPRRPRYAPTASAPPASPPNSPRRARPSRWSSSGTVSTGTDYSWLRIVRSVIFVSAASIIALLRITASIRSPS
ncbi:M48 family metallopeptidase [Streptomyces aquilus]|uniref:M48 family metallopeptidase n=1 Tax=Streptomyces aquilus TaxID=2548456 RepID=UPI00368D12A3